MKWVFLSLLAINVVIVSIQWVDSRARVAPEQYFNEVGSKQLELLAEVGGEELLVGQDSSMCVLVGPLDTKSIADEIFGSLGGNDGRAKLLEQEVKKAPSYWVYFDAYEGRSVAAWLEEFKLKKVDSYVIGTGDLKGMLSLGVFENIDLAYRLKKMMKKKLSISLLLFLIYTFGLAHFLN